MKTKGSIKNWAQDDRPREKLLLKGPEALSHSELLAILIHNGSKEKSAVALAQEILQLANNDLNDLGKLIVSDFSKIKGIGPAKAVTIVAALELSRRRQQIDLSQKTYIKSSRDAYVFLSSRLSDYTHEVFAILLLNAASKLVHYEVVSEGGVTGTIADPRIIFKIALNYGATSLILAHNHPSGSTNPSRQDIELTTSLKQAGSIMQVTVIDHIIIGDSTYYSFADNGTLT